MDDFVATPVNPEMLHEWSLRHAVLYGTSNSTPKIRHRPYVRRPSGGAMQTQIPNFPGKTTQLQ